MSQSELSGHMLAPAGAQDATHLSASNDSGSSSQKSGIYLFERICYHGFVGAFLALIPVFWIGIANLFASPYRGTILFAVWTILAVSYAYWRVKSELVGKRGNNKLNRWVINFLQSPINILLVGLLVCGLLAMVDGFHRDFFVLARLFTIVWLFSCFAKYLRHVEEIAKQNRQKIETWVAEGSDEEERNRRRAYVLSGALMAGAAAAGEAEYDDTSDTDWLTSPGTPPQNYDSGCSMTCQIWHNPATGLPMVDDMPGGIDVGGNLWGHNSFN